MLFVSRTVRMLAYGSTGTVLAGDQSNPKRNTTSLNKSFVNIFNISSHTPLPTVPRRPVYLSKLGVSDERIGSLLTLTLVGDAGISLAITSHGDGRVGRRFLLILGCALMTLSGIVFAIAKEGASQLWFWLLVIAATVGVISPFGNEVGPFMALEQAILAQTLHDSNASVYRTYVFSWYNVAGYLATGVGSVLGGAVCQYGPELLHSAIPLVGFRAVFLSYSVSAVLLALIFTLLTTAVEAPKPTAQVAAREALQNEAEARQPLLAGEAATAEGEEEEGSAERRDIAPPPPPAPRSFFGVPSTQWKLVGNLSGLFALDAFGGGLINGTLLAYFFKTQFNSTESYLGTVLLIANVISAASSLVAGKIAERFGLINTMVFTHLPSNVLLICIGLAPTELIATILVALRFSISQMDVGPRASYVAGVVPAECRTAVIGVTNVVRSLGAAAGPTVTGILAARGQYGLAFVLAGSVKIVYDILLLWSFRKTRADIERQR